MRDPSKGHAALRKRRWSARDTMYFLTICLRSGQTGLDTKELFETSLTILRTLEKDSIKTLQCLVHMPDHIHILIESNSDSNLPDIVRLYKGRMTPYMRKSGLNWEAGYFDRRLRAEDSVGAVMRYMLMNPYRKHLINDKCGWPFWYCTKQAETWIGIAEEKNLPEPEWL
jgi:putative transposase